MTIAMVFSEWYETSPAIVTHKNWIASQTALPSTTTLTYLGVLRPAKPPNAITVGLSATPTHREGIISISVPMLSISRMKVTPWSSSAYVPKKTPELLEQSRGANARWRNEWRTDLLVLRRITTSYHLITHRLRSAAIGCRGASPTQISIRVRGRH